MPPDSFSPYITAVHAGRMLQLEKYILRMLNICIVTQDMGHAKDYLEMLNNSRYWFCMASETLDNPNNFQIWKTHQQMMGQLEDEEIL